MRPSTRLESHSDTASAFPEQGRFSPRGVLGRGAFGVVYAVEDRLQGTTVAAKLLHSGRPRALAGFKREFRKLADLHHPNLVRLYELHAQDARWFFTMELVEGRDPLSWLGDRSSEHVVEPTLSASSTSPVLLAKGELQPPRVPVWVPHDAERVRGIFAQVAHGLHALHSAELLHRDLKPSNVLVDDAGHVKLLDFGLVRTLSDPTEREAGPAGTPAYMAPELWTDAAPSAAADWFAMGVTLHQALTGQLPEPANESASVTTLDMSAEDMSSTHGVLVELCRDLLSHDPTRRPTGADVLARLGAGAGSHAVWRVNPGPVLVGREPQMQRLQTILRQTRRGGSQAVLVRGVSGIGKSALTREFCKHAQAQGALVLAGRCFQQEAVPFKALDGVVDALATTLCGPRRSDPAVQQTLGRYGASLARVFEVLRMVPGMVSGTGVAQQVESSVESHQIRRHGFEGLRELLMTLAATQPVVIFVDDLQWGDAESAERLAALIRAPKGPGILLVGTCRTDEAQTPFFTAWSKTLHTQQQPVPWQRMDLAPLGADVCEALARTLLAKDSTTRADATSIARESGGSPFFIEQLVQHAGRLTAGQARPRVSLVDAVHERITSLPDEERRLLELVAVAGQPIALEPLARAAQLHNAAYAVLDTLRAAHLAKTRQVGPTLLVESYHDAIREASLQIMDDVSAAHRALGDAMESASFDDRGRIAHHLVAGASLQRAVPHAIAAAESAAAGLAFERAAGFWKLAADCVAIDDPRRGTLSRKRAKALVQCGRGAEAAPLFEQLAKVNNDDDEDLRNASEQWLTSGHFDLGSAVLRALLARDGLRWPTGPGSTMAAVARDLAWVTMARGRPKPPPYDESKLARVDTCWAAVRGLASIDHIRGLYFVVHGMRLALSAGEPHRIARFGTFLGAQLRAVGLMGGPRLFDRYKTLALQTADPVLTIYVDYLEGYVQLQKGDPVAAGDVLGTAIDRFEQECRGVGWEISIALNMLCESVSERGDMNELSALSERALERAQSLGDINGLQGATGFLGLCALAQDRPRRARLHYDELLKMWTAEGFHYPHFITGLCRNLCDLYEGKPADAWARTETWLPQLKASGLDRAPYVQAKTLARRAACGMALLATTPKPDAVTARSVRKIVERSIAKLAKLDRPDGAAEVAQLRAGLAAIDGDWDRAERSLGMAQDAFERLGLTHRVHVCQLRRAQAGDDAGQSMANARASIEALGIIDADRWAAAYAPGFPQRS